MDDRVLPGGARRRPSRPYCRSGVVEFHRARHHLAGGGRRRPASKRAFGVRGRHRNGRLAKRVDRRRANGQPPGNRRAAGDTADRLDHLPSCRAHDRADEHDASHRRRRSAGGGVEHDAHGSRHPCCGSSGDRRHCAAPDLSLLDGGCGRWDHDGRGLLEFHRPGLRRDYVTGSGRVRRVWGVLRGISDHFARLPCVLCGHYRWCVGGGVWVSSWGL